MIQSPYKIPYKTSWTSIVALGVLGALGTSFWVAFALTNHQGHVFGHIIHLSPHASTVLFWVLASIPMLLVVLAGLLLAVKMTTDRFLELTPDAVILPHGLFQMKLSRVPYSAITGISEITVETTKVLCLQTAARKYEIPASLLPSNDVYVQLKQFLFEKTGADPAAPPHTG